MSNINKQALREAAEKATPGDWCSDDRHGVIADSGLNGNYYIASCSGPEHRANKLFIAAANPATVLALLDELEAKDRRNAELNSTLERWAADRARSASELDDAEKRIAELEAREVKIPELKMLRDYLAEVTHREREDILLGVKLEFHRELQAAGIITKVGE